MNFARKVHGGAINQIHDPRTKQGKCEVKSGKQNVASIADSSHAGGVGDEKMLAVSWSNERAQKKSSKWSEERCAGIELSNIGQHVVAILVWAMPSPENLSPTTLQLRPSVRVLVCRVASPCSMETALAMLLMQGPL